MEFTAQKSNRRFTRTEVPSGWQQIVEIVAGEPDRKSLSDGGRAGLFPTVKLVTGKGKNGPVFIDPVVAKRFLQWKSEHRAPNAHFMPHHGNGEGPVTKHKHYLIDAVERVETAEEANRAILLDILSELRALRAIWERA